MQKIYFGNRNKIMYSVLVIYDITDDRRRTRFARLLESYGRRVQLSAFEFWLDEIRYRELKEKMNKMTDGEDNVRIYELRKTACSPNGTEIKSECLYDVYIA